MQREAKIREKITATFAPVVLEVINESEQHRGHGGYSDGESHFRIRMRDASFVGQTRIGAIGRCTRLWGPSWWPKYMHWHWNYLSLERDSDLGGFAPPNPPQDIWGQKMLYSRVGCFEPVILGDLLQCSA